MIMTDHKPKPETRSDIWLDIAYHAVGMLLAVCLILGILLLQR